MVNQAFRFYYLRGKYVLLRHVCNAAVEAHVRLTPRSATPDTLNEIALERIGAFIRRTEFRCHTLKQQYEAIGKAIVNESAP